MAEIAQLLGHKELADGRDRLREIQPDLSAQGSGDTGILMVGAGRIELPTFAMSKQRSTTELGALTVQ